MNKDHLLLEVNGHTVKQLERHIINPNYYTEKQQVFIIGSKGIPAAYGGFETFVEKLTAYKVSEKIRYHVSCISNSFIRFEYNYAKCFTIKVPNIGAAKAIIYDVMALNACIKYCNKRPVIKNPIFYVLACRIGPFMGYFKKRIDKINGVLYVNPDGHEWKRAKWPIFVKKYWKFSEAGMVKHADLLICDSKNIEKYIQNTYKRYQPQTTFIAYGCDMTPSTLENDNNKFTDWMRQNKLNKKEYYLVVGRFVPENSFEIMIREFMKSTSERDFVIVTKVDERFLKKLETKLHFEKDPRIKFVGTVYDQDLLKKIREMAYAYCHGHTVGGTNPSLIEALGSTDLNLLINVKFNREVAEDCALYWTQEEGNLASLINSVDGMSQIEIEKFGKRAKKRIANEYTWQKIINQYEALFLKGLCI